jgi:hypothetical protein
MARMNLHALRQAHKYCDVPKFSDVADDGVCSPYREGKATKLPFRGNFEHADKIGEIIHSDMAGKLPVSFPDRCQYISNFTDDNSRHACKRCFYAAQEPVTPSFYGFPP